MSTNTINATELMQEYMWFRYLPETTYKTYIMIGRLQNEDIVGEEASKKLLTSNFEIEHESVIIKHQKQEVLNRLGFKYPTNRLEDLNLLLSYNLIKVAKDENDNLIYLYNLPIPKPEDVINMDEKERQSLEGIRFEFNHQHDINAILTFILDSSSRLSTTLEHIHNTTNISHSDVKLVLEYLAKEGSINVTSDKPINNLRKEDKVYISINKDIFEEKRFIIE